MSIDRSLLYYFARDALRQYSDDFETLDRSNPYRFRLNKNIYSIHISHIHDSGNHRDNEDEVRKQLSRTLIEKQRERQKKGEVVGFLGFYEEGDVFLAWDPEYVFGLKAQTSVSVYGRQSQVSETSSRGYSKHNFRSTTLKKDTFSIALPSNSLGFYLENYEKFYTLKNEDSFLQVTALIDEIGLSAPVNSTKISKSTIDEDRQVFVSTRIAYKRSGKFKTAVLNAYKNKCCICDKQLKIVQAAHIIPHSEDHSNDHVTNGLALCVEHHKLYDDALLLPGPERALIFNEKRASFLVQSGLDAGLEEVAARAKSPYAIPDDNELRPNTDFLAEGLRIRLSG